MYYDAFTISEKTPDEYMIAVYHSTVTLDCSEFNDEGGEGGGGVLEWRFNRKKLQVKEGYSGTHGSDYILLLNDVSLGSQGDYSCVMLGRILKTFFVEVVGKLISLSFKLSFSLSFPPRYVDVVPPFIIGTNATKTVSFNSFIKHASLDCSYFGKPSPSLEWRHNSGPIGMSSKYSVFHNGTLVIYYINSFTDVGAYTCIASNNYGTTTLSYQVTIVN